MAGKGNILVIDDLHPYFMEHIHEAGYTCDYRPDIKRPEILEILPAYTGMVVRSKTPIDKPLLERGTQLKFIGRAGSGTENIDMLYAAEREITCISVPEANRDAVAEHAVGMLLSLINNIHVSYNEIRNGIWRREENRGYELGDMTVGIIGFGNTGSALAKKLSGFGCHVLAYDKYHGISSPYASEATMDILFSEADVISLHIPLTDETRHLINAGYLNRFKKNIFLINSSRGGIANTLDIIACLRTGKLRGAALDVLENEKFSQYSDEDKAILSNLLSFNNVLLTSHIAGWTHESYYKISYSLIEKIKHL